MSDFNSVNDSVSGELLNKKENLKRGKNTGKKGKNNKNKKNKNKPAGKGEEDENEIYKKKLMEELSHNILEKIDDIGTLKSKNGIRFLI